MTKQGEIDYPKNIGNEGIQHAFDKPFSDVYCGRYLMELGALMLLLPPPPAKLLDLGCGTGWTSCLFAKRGYDVTGLDISEMMIDYANQNKEREKIDHLKFIVSDYENMNFKNEFDCAVFFDSLHHSDNEEDAIKMVYKALKPGGICITSEPGIFHQRSKTSIDVMKKYNVTEKDMPPRTIIKTGKKVGFKAFKIYPHTSSNAIVYGKTSRGGFLGRLFRWSPIRIIAAIFVIIFYKKFSGIVLMMK